MPTSVSLRRYSSRWQPPSASETDGSHRAGHVRHRATPVAHGRHRARGLTPRADRRLVQEPQSTAAAVVVVPQQRVKILLAGPLTLARARATPRRRGDKTVGSSRNINACAHRRTCARDSSKAPGAPIVSLSASTATLRSPGLPSGTRTTIALARGANDSSQTYKAATQIATAGDLMAPETHIGGDMPDHWDPADRRQRLQLPPGAAHKPTPRRNR